jgi:hypothetical protein
MENVDSYHVAVTSSTSPVNATESSVDVDFQAPNRYHAFAHDSGTTNEQVWTDLIYARVCQGSSCDVWQTIPRSSTSSALAEEIAGFPTLPLLALKYVRSADVSQVNGSLEINGTFDFGSALAGEAIACTQRQLGTSTAPLYSTCPQTVASGGIHEANFDVWADPETLLLSRAQIDTSAFGDSGDLIYGYSAFGQVSVDPPTNVSSR